MNIKIKSILLYIIFILGYANLSFELIILRQLINFIGSSTLVTSIIISFILLFLSFGYYLGYKYEFKINSTRNKIQNYLCFLPFYYAIICNYEFLKTYFSIFSYNYYSLIAIFIFSIIFLSPVILIGYMVSIIGRMIGHFDNKYIGPFMAIDTIGSVLGSLCTTLLCMPFLGMYWTIIILVILTYSPLLMLINRYNAKNKIFYYSISTIGIIVSMLINKNNNPYLVKDDLISRFEIIEIRDEQSRLMKINNSLSSKISKDNKNMFKYVKFINSNIINNIPNDKIYDILILGAGGFTIGIDDNINNYTYLDIEKNIKQISEEKFLLKPLGKNKHFIRRDAYNYVLYTKNKYDIVVIDLYSSKFEIPETFVTYEFFEKIKNILNINGILVINIITNPLFNTDFSITIDNTLKNIFKHSLTRQIIHDFNPFQNSVNNIIYIYKHNKNTNNIYRIDRNSIFFDLF